MNPVESSAPETSLDCSGLEGLEKIVRFAEKISDEELERMRKDNPNVIPGKSPAWNIYCHAKEELSCRRKRLAEESPVPLSREELELALSPLAAFQLILARAGQTDIDINAQDTAIVLGALLRTSYERIGFPLLGDVI